MTIFPEDTSVLYLQATHISNAVSSETIDLIVKAKRSDNLIWVLYNDNHIHDRVLQHLNSMGFYGVLQCGSRVYDNHLITALVERWRRETHTFHFRCGEATITLQDVSIIWGLRIDGEPVTGIDESKTVEEWQYICLELLGFEPPQNHFKGNHLSLSPLYEYCMSTIIDDNSLEEDVVKYSRIVALMILGGIMFPDYQGGSVRLLFLQLLRDINDVRSYSWGSAVLAFLYRELCNATRIGKCIITGPLYILQIWAWSRIKFVNPDIQGLTMAVPEPEPNEIAPIPPYGARWQKVFSHVHAPTHTIRIIRDCFDRMQNDEFNWIIYRKNDIDVKQITDSYNTKIWRCVCPLVCFEIVEMYRPNRVMRQFRRQQSIPVPALDNDDLHNITRIGHRNTDWKLYHKDAIILWNRKWSHVAHGRPIRSSQTDDDYFQWYERITVRVISPPVHGVGFRPYPYDYSGAERQNIPLPFSTPSPGSHHSSFGFDPQPSGFAAFAGPSRGFGTAGSSGHFHIPGPSGHLGTAGSSGHFDIPGPSGHFGTAGSSGHFDIPGPSGHFDIAGPSGQGDQTAGPSGGVGQGYQTPFWENIHSFTDLLNIPRPQIVHDMPPNRNINSPIYFPGYGDAGDHQNMELRRGERERRPTDCGTGSHLYHNFYDSDSDI